MKQQKSITALSLLAKNIVPSSNFLEQFITPISIAEQAIRAGVSSVQEALAKHGPIIAETARPIADIGAELDAARRLKEAGWIPHPVLPIRELTAEPTLQGISASAQMYIDNNLCISLSR